MSDKESQQGSEGEHNVRVLDTDLRYGATIHVEEEDIETKKIYTPLRLLVKKKVDNPFKPPMSASRGDRLAFFRAYTTTPSKSYFICWRTDIITDVLYISMLFNMVLACLSVYFIHIFLGVFAPEHHMFITKMVPLFSGISVMYFFTAILELSRITDIIMIFLDYFASAVFLLLPWNACEYNDQLAFKVESENRNYSYNCLTLDQFRASHGNASLARLERHGHFSCYLNEERGTCDQIAQLVFVIAREIDVRSRPMLVLGYFLLIWTLSAIWYKHVFKRILYKLMTLTQVIGNIFYLYFFIHINFVSDVQSLPRKAIMMEQPEKKIHEDQAWLLWDVIQLVVGSLTISPPMLHLLSARCEKVNPNPDSFFMTLGNVLLLLYRTWINFYVHSYTDKLLNGFILECPTKSVFVYPCLYYWLIFFASLKLGNFFCLVFLIVNMITEYLVLIVMFHFVIEVYVSVIQQINRLVVILFVYMVTLTLYMTIHEERRLLSHLCRVVVLTVEVVAIFAMYPLRRLFDDLTFYHGTHPSRMRSYSTLVVPFSLLLILTGVAVYLPMDLNHENNNKLVIYIVLLFFMAVPFFGGIAYQVFYFFHIQQGKLPPVRKDLREEELARNFTLQEWMRLFCPLREWGPTNFIARQLRKQFDSHVFVASQAPRILSRYLVKNSEPESYKLDIIYDTSLVLEPLEGQYEQKKMN